MADTAGDKPAATRLWVALQKLSRLRDHYSRDPAAAGRVGTARAMADLAAEVQALTAEVLAEAERAAASPPAPDAGHAA